MGLTRRECLQWGVGAVAALVPLRAVRAATHYTSLLQAREYQLELDKARKQKRWVPRFDPEMVQRNPKKYASKLLEASGRITDIRLLNERTTLTLTSPGPVVTYVSIPATFELADWDFLKVGERIRVLCRVEQPEEEATPYFEQWIPVLESELLVLRQRREVSALHLAMGRLKGPNVPVGALVVRYVGIIRSFNRNIESSQARTIAATIIDCSRRNGLDSRLALAVIARESAFNPKIDSPVGAKGLGQLMPATAKDLGVTNVYDIGQNLSASIRYLTRHVTEMSRGRSYYEGFRLALACYNAGLGNVRKHHGIPPFKETQEYVRWITRHYWLLLDDRERLAWKAHGWVPV